MGRYARVMGAMATEGVRLDAAQTAFIERQLEQVEAEVIRQPYPALIGRQVVPVTHQARPGTQTIVARIMDRTGIAQRIKSYADNLPRAGVSVREDRVPVHVYGLGYGYTFAELRAAAVAGMPLDAEEAQAAREGFELRVDEIAAKGNGEGLIGILNLPNANAYVVPNGAGGFATFAKKTPDEILADLFAMATKSAELTNGVEAADTLLLPLEQYHLCTTKRLGATNETTVLKFFLENNPYIKTVIPWYRCKGAGTAGADLMVAYRRDPSRIRLEIPMEYLFHSPQEKGLGVEIPGEGEIAGVICRRQMSVTYGSGI